LGVTALLAGQQPAPIKLDFIQWIMRLLPLIPLLQVVGVFATLRLLHRWHDDPALRPSSGRIWGQHILLPLIPNLTLAAILAYLRSSGLLRYMHLFNPDLAWIARISGGFAGLWVFLRTGLFCTPETSAETSKVSQTEGLFLETSMKKNRPYQVSIPPGRRMAEHA
jgi:hypothetical protein